MTIRVGSVTTEALTDGSTLRVGGAQVESLSRSGKRRVAAVSTESLSVASKRRVGKVLVEVLTIEFPPPNAPLNLSPVNLTNSTVSVYWTPSPEGEQPLSYEYSLNGSAPVNVALADHVDLTGLTSATQYTFRVRTVGAQAVSAWSTLVFTTTAPPPNAPINVTFSAITSSSADVNWAKGVGGSPVTGFEYQIDSRTPVQTSQYVVGVSMTDLSSSTVHTFRIRALGDSGASAWTTATFTTFGPPAAPTGLVISNVAATTATAGWTASPTATSYQYSLNGGPTVNVAAGTNVNLIGLSAETAYSFAIRAVNQYGSSAWVTAPFQTAVGVPNPPLALTLSSSTSTTATASWFVPTTGSTPTNFQYSLDGGTAIDLPAGVTSLTVDGLLPGSPHEIRVRSKNSVGTSSWERIEFILNPGAPDAPVNVTAFQITREGATVKWAPSISGPVVEYYEYSLDYSEVLNAGLVQQIIFENMTPGSTHSFRVRGVGEFGTSPWVEITFAILPPLEPEPETLRIQWNESGDRHFENGIDRGVLYLPDGSGVAWNGLTGLEEDLGDESTEPFYFDGEKYLDAMLMGDFSGSLRAITYPDEFLQFEGYGTIGQGVYADDQAVDIFALSYRTLVGNDVVSDEFGYKLHIVYNLSAYPDAKTHSTHSDSPTLTEFGWTITSVPVHIAGHRPTAHVIFDSRYMNKYVLRGIETILYGDGIVRPRLPTIAELIEFVDNFTFIQIFDNGDGTWTARGPDELIEMIDETTFVIHDANAVYLDEDTYQIDSS